MAATLPSAGSKDPPVGKFASRTAADAVRVALIATVFNEAENLGRWWECITGQSRMPDEIAIVDGGSRDGTWEKLQEWAGRSPVPVKLEQRPCNIAAGRNLSLIHI